MRQSKKNRNPKEEGDWKKLSTVLARNNKEHADEDETMTEDTVGRG